MEGNVLTPSAAGMWPLNKPFTQAAWSSGGRLAVSSGRRAVMLLAGMQHVVLQRKLEGLRRRSMRQDDGNVSMLMDGSQDGTQWLLQLGRLWSTVLQDKLDRARAEFRLECRRAGETQEAWSRAAAELAGRYHSLHARLASRAGADRSWPQSRAWKLARSPANAHAGGVALEMDARSPRLRRSPRKLLPPGSPEAGTRKLPEQERLRNDCQQAGDLWKRVEESCSSVEQLDRLLALSVAAGGHPHAIRGSCVQAARAEAEGADAAGQVGDVVALLELWSLRINQLQESAAAAAGRKGARHELCSERRDCSHLMHLEVAGSQHDAALVRMKQLRDNLHAAADRAEVEAREIRAQLLRSRPESPSGPTRPHAPPAADGGSLRLPLVPLSPQADRTAAAHAVLNCGTPATPVVRTAAAATAAPPTAAAAAFNARESGDRSRTPSPRPDRASPPADLPQLEPGSSPLVPWADICRDARRLEEQLLAQADVHSGGQPQDALSLPATRSLQPEKGLAAGTARSAAAKPASASADPSLAWASPMPSVEAASVAMGISLRSAASPRKRQQPGGNDMSPHAPLSPRAA